MEKIGIKREGLDFSKVEEKFNQVQTLEDLTGPNGPVQELLKQAVEGILKGEQAAHLGYPPYQKTDGGQNSRNGYSAKKIKTQNGEIAIAVPRDREGTFEPQLIKKYQNIDPKLENQILSLYGRGLSTRDISLELQGIYGAEVSPSFISSVTDKLSQGITEWQNRPLDSVYPVLFLDAIHYKVRGEGKVMTKAAYTCLGIDMEGKSHILGIWVAESEGAKFWLSVLNDLKSRGIEDIIIACVDGLKGFPEAIQSAFPKTEVQLCIIHQIRTSLRYLASKHQRAFMIDLKEVYKASTLEQAEAQLDALEARWAPKCPMAVRGWRDNWTELSTYFNFSAEIRRMIYTTNAVEAVHRQFRKVTKTKGAFPSDDALKKLLYLTSLNAEKNLRSKQRWPEILGELKIKFADRIPNSRF